MVFSSHIFVFYYLPLLLLIYYALPGRFRNGFLTLGSYIFYGWWEPWFVTLMWVSTAVDYGAGRIISAESSGPRKRKTALIVALTTNLGLLGVFKYAMFAQDNINGLLSMLGLPMFQVYAIALPIGISFYTFQTMSYTIDVYRKVAPPVRSFGDFACFVSLFPHLVAGPIIRYNTVASQLVAREHTWTRFSSGVYLFVLGFAKKTLLANPMGLIADPVFAADHPGAAAAWLGVLAYSFQLYFDFAGYSDMAVGLGRMFGLEIPRNFDAPYHAESITEFWRRWHISLSTFLRDYLYVALGGNRLGPVRTYVNLAAVMLLGGLWHGAHWQFIIWGAYHGLFLCVERFFGRRTVYAGLPRVLRVLCTFLLVSLAWVPFRAANLGAAVRYWGAMCGAESAGPAASLLSGVVFSRASLLSLSICTLFIFARLQAWDFARTLSVPRSLLILGLFVITAAAMFAQSFNPFLYFQF